MHVLSRILATLLGGVLSAECFGYCQAAAQQQDNDAKSRTRDGWQLYF